MYRCAFKPCSLGCSQRFLGCKGILHPPVWHVGVLFSGLNSGTTTCYCKRFGWCFEGLMCSHGTNMRVWLECIALTLQYRKIQLFVSLYTKRRGIFHGCCSSTAAATAATTARPTTTLTTARTVHWISNLPDQFNGRFWNAKGNMQSCFMFVVEYSMIHDVTTLFSLDYLYNLYCMD